MIHSVLTLPNDQLREKSRPLSAAEVADKSLPKLIEEMKATMKVENGVGLAAPQIGKKIRLIIAQTDKGPEAFINPEIIEKSFRQVDSEEGCLSIPGVWGLVKRHRTVKIKALNAKGEEITRDCRGLLAIIFQHEIDHLDGVLFIDRAFELREPSTMSGNIV